MKFMIKRCNGIALMIYPPGIIVGGVGVTDGVGVSDGVRVMVGVDEGVKVMRGVRVGTFEGVNVAVLVGVMVGAITLVGVTSACSGYSSRMAWYHVRPPVLANVVKRAPL